MYYHAKLREDATLKNQIRKSLTWRRNIKYKFVSSSEYRGSWYQNVCCNINYLMYLNFNRRVNLAKYLICNENSLHFSVNSSLMAKISSLYSLDCRLFYCNLNFEQGLLEVELVIVPLYNRSCDLIMLNWWP